MSNKIHIYNNTGVDILVMVTPNKDFTPGDIAFSFVKSAVITAATAGAGTGAAAAQTVGTITKTIKNLKDLYSLYSKVEKVYKLADAASQKYMHSSIERVRNLFRESSIQISPGDYKLVNEKFINPFENVKSYIPQEYKKAFITVGAQAGQAGEVAATLALSQLESYTAVPQVLYNMWKNIDPSVSLSVFDFVGDATVFIATTDFKMISSFNSNSDHSWIVNKTDIVRAKYKTLTKEDRESGWHIFSNSFGAILAKDDCLEPNDSLDIQTVNYEGLTDYTHDISKVVDHIEIASAKEESFFKRIALAVFKKTFEIAKITHKAAQVVINTPSVMFSFPYKLVYQPDGNLVLHHIKGDYPKPIWATGTDGKAPGKVCMQSDGNLVIYGPKNEVHWALWKVMPQGYENSYIGLHKISGKLAYYKNGNKEPEFYISDKTDWYKA